MTAPYIICSNGGFGGVFAASGSVSELSSYHKQTPSQLLSVRAVIANS